MVAAYSTGGGFLFQMIEEGHERGQIVEGRLFVNLSTKLHIERLWNMTNRLNVLYPENWTAEAKIVLSQYQVCCSYDSESALTNHLA